MSRNPRYNRNMTKHEETEIRELAEEILALPGVESKLLEIIKKRPAGWLKAMGITPRMIKAMEKELG